MGKIWGLSSLVAGFWGFGLLVNYYGVGMSEYFELHDTCDSVALTDFGFTHQCASEYPPGLEIAEARSLLLRAGGILIIYAVVTVGGLATLWWRENMAPASDVGRPLSPSWDDDLL